MFYLVNKPKGKSSFYALKQFRKILGIKKIGHVGTLDPLASGLLLVATGHSTKLIPLLEGQNKTYVFTMRLDGTTESLDLGTEVMPLNEDILSNAQKTVTKKGIEELIKAKFTGEIEQIPPAYSAIWIDGKRAYDLARKWLEVALKSRKTTIFAIKLLQFSFPEVTLQATVSSGTYIRSIARDIWTELWLGGYITDLQRTELGNLELENPKTFLLKNTPNQDTETEKPIALSTTDLFADYSVFEVSDDRKQAILQNGVIPNLINLPVGTVFLHANGNIFALVENTNGVIKILKNNIELTT